MLGEIVQKFIEIRISIDPKQRLGLSLDRYHLQQGSPVNHQKQIDIPSVPCRGFADTVGSHREDEMIHDKAAARKFHLG